MGIRSGTLAEFSWESLLVGAAGNGSFLCCAKNGRCGIIPSKTKEVMVVQKWPLNDEWQYILIAYAILTTVILMAVLIFIWPLPEMVEFAGALVGAAVGGVISLTIMYFTNKEGRKNVEKTIEANRKLEKEKEALQIKPYIVASIEEKNKQCDFVFKCNPKYISIKQASLQERIFVFENVGLGPAIDFVITQITIDGQEAERIVENGYIDEQYALSIGQKVIGVIRWDYGSSTDGKHWGNKIAFIIEYSDITGKRYYQKIIYDTTLNLCGTFGSDRKFSLKQYKLINETPKEKL